MNRYELLFNCLSDKIDAVLITSDINRRYFSGMKSSAGYIIAFREKAYLLIDFRYYEKAKITVTSCEVILMKKFNDQITDILKKNNAKTVAIESDNVTLAQYADLKEVLSGYKLDSSSVLSNAINTLRAVKTTDEIEKITTAQRIAEKSFENVLNFIKPGVTEKEIALQLDFFMLKSGAEALSFDTIALTGRNTSLPHGVPSEQPVKSGDFVLMDFGAVYDGYHSDMTRTICVGEPTDEMSKVYNIVLEAQAKALSKAKANISGSELDSIARNYIDNNGYGENFGHGLGHGVGMEIHEFPNISPSSKTILKENMVITIEPGIYLENNFGARIEDFVVIKDNDCKNITKSVKKLISV